MPVPPVMFPFVKNSMLMVAVDVKWAHVWNAEFRVVKLRDESAVTQKTSQVVRIQACEVRKGSTMESGRLLEPPQKKMSALGVKHSECAPTDTQCIEVCLAWFYKSWSDSLAAGGSGGRPCARGTTGVPI